MFNQIHLSVCKIKETTRNQEDIKHIQDWLVEQHYLGAWTDKQWILKFLRGCKLSLQRTKEKLDVFYRLRTILPEYFANRDPLAPDIQECLQEGHIMLLTDSSNNVRSKMLLIRAETLNPDKFNSAATVIKVLTMVLDVLLLEDDAFITSGLQIIIDLKHIPHKCTMQLTPSFLKTLIRIFQNSYPIRLKTVFLINVPKSLETLLPLLKAFVCGKIKDRINLYYNLDEVYKIVPFLMLPNEYGGGGGCIDDLTFGLKVKLESYQEWFLQEVACCPDETKRREISNTAKHIFEEENSSKKLDLDYQEHIINCKRKYSDL